LAARRLSEIRKPRPAAVVRLRSVFFGEIRGARDARITQFGLKLLW